MSCGPIAALPRRARGQNSHLPSTTWWWVLSTRLPITPMKYYRPGQNGLLQFISCSWGEWNTNLTAGQRLFCVQSRAEPLKCLSILLRNEHENGLGQDFNQKGSAPLSFSLCFPFFGFFVFTSLCRGGSSIRQRGVCAISQPASERKNCHVY